jgi:hypothetical protein
VTAADAAREHAEIVRARLRSLVEVDQPLVLITQAPRSGGTLLVRLFDGHPACHAFPHEMATFAPAGHKLLQGAEQAWEVLEDRKLRRILAEGHMQSKQKLNQDRSLYPLLIAPVVHRELFLERYAALEDPSPRQVLDAFMTAYFNAWLDNRNLYGPGAKRWVVGFAPHVVSRENKRRHFDEHYPDGRVISIVRDPWSWYASARRWSPRWRERDAAIAEWTAAAAAARDWRAEDPERVRVVAFERLLRAPQETTAELAAFLGIEPTPGLLEPTINGLPAAANSSFAGTGPGISTGPLDRARDELAPEDVAAIDETAGPLYAELGVAAGANS